MSKRVIQGDMLCGSLFFNGQLVAEVTGRNCESNMYVAMRFLHCDINDELHKKYPNIYEVHQTYSNPVKNSGFNMASAINEILFKYILPKDHKDYFAWTLFDGLKAFYQDEFPDLAKTAILSKPYW